MYIKHKIDGPKIGRELFAYNLGFKILDKDCRVVGRDVEKIRRNLEDHFGNDVINKNNLNYLFPNDVEDKNTIRVSHSGGICNPFGEHTIHWLNKIRAFPIKNKKYYLFKILDPFLVDQFILNGVINSKGFMDMLSDAERPCFIWTDSTLFRFGNAYDVIYHRRSQYNKSVEKSIMASNVLVKK